MYAITAHVENYTGQKVTLVSKKKWASYEDAHKNLENYIETIPDTNIVIGYYVSEVDDEDKDY